jgi:DNA-binding response OmpR family regulator
MAKYEILLLGDGSHLFRTMAWVLEYKGYAVKTAISPEAALEALVKKNYDLVIAKLSMSGSDGVDVLKRAKRLNPEVKIMVVSGNHDVTFPPEAYQIDVDDYLLMPISPTEMWRRVSQCLESLEIVDLVPIQVNPAPSGAAVNESGLDRGMMMFHDLRASMLSTAASLKLLLRGRYGEMNVSALAKLQEISDNVDKLILLTEEFMNQTMADRDLEQEVLDLQRDVVSPILEELAGELRHQRITLFNRLNQTPDGTIAVKGSKFWLKSVFRNLVHNGIRHGGRGCTIVIDWEKQGNHWCLNVYNSGKPVPEAECSMLFSDSRKTRRGKGDGMGIGLYLSRDIVTRHGGDLFYEPRQDGANFVVSLPQA